MQMQPVQNVQRPMTYEIVDLPNLHHFGTTQNREFL